MATFQQVFLADLNTTFDIGVTEANKISIKIDGTLVKNADGSLGLSGGSLTVVSPDAGNIIIPDTNGKAFLNQAAIQAIETVWSGSEPDSFLTITPGGTNGHTVTYGFDWTNAAFVEAVQDAIGVAALAGAGITYDDVANTISTTLGNITFGDGLNYAADVVSVKPDTSSPYTVGVTSAGVSVTPVASSDANNLFKIGSDNRGLVDSDDIKALATVDVCNAFGVLMYKAFPV